MANDHLFNFTIDENTGAGIDAVTDTDGIDVTNANLGGQLSSGAFFAHDNSNPGHSISNIKLVAWSDVADEISPNLVIDTSWDPRSVGLQPVPGDADGDLDVDTADYHILLNQFGRRLASASADFNDDGVVDLADFVIQRGNFGFPAASDAPGELGAHAPEPGVLLILTFGAAIALPRRRRKKQ